MYKKTKSIKARILQKSPREAKPLRSVHPQIERQAMIPAAPALEGALEADPALEGALEADPALEGALEARALEGALEAQEESQALEGVRAAQEESQALEGVRAAPEGAQALEGALEADPALEGALEAATALEGALEAATALEGRLADFSPDWTEVIAGSASFVPRLVVQHVKDLGIRPEIKSHLAGNEAEKPVK
ncbi:Collagen alpha-2(IV) [Labeo rohita]|uniref:Collagen alpha-2(IV) n=1 Tax=Labeo rohita TaxID=84645 RepID=A0A498P626_LABRO|nr:Collagen alpha-2(IV) [Labeo rohita]